MIQTITKKFYGEDAEFFMKGKVTIKEIKELSRERSVVEITFEGVEK